MKHQYNSTNGNVLFIILITVALFAALSYAVSNSFRGGANTISDEQARIAAGEILRSMDAIKQGYDYLWNQQGCSMDDIAFDNPASTNVTCQIFHPQGAGIQYPNNLSQYQTGTVTGTYTFWFASSNPGGTYGVDTLGTSSSDHMVWLLDVTNTICINLNKLSDYSGYVADLVDAGNVVGDASGNVFRSKNAGCRARALGGPYDVFYVMQAL